MPLVEAKCTNCGAGLQVDNLQERAVCGHCHATFLIEKAINNFNVGQMTNEIKDSVVNIYSGDYVSQADLLKKGEALVTIEDYSAGSAVYNRMTADFPGDWRGWWGQVLCASEGGRKYLSAVPFYFKRVKKLAVGSDLQRCLTWYDTYCRNMAKAMAKDGMIGMKMARVAKLASIDAVKISSIEATNDLLEKTVRGFGQIIGTPMTLFGLYLIAYQGFIVPVFSEATSDVIWTAWLIGLPLMICGAAFNSHGTKKPKYKDLLAKRAELIRSIEDQKALLQKDDAMMNGDHSAIEERDYQMLLAEVQ